MPPVLLQFWQQCQQIPAFEPGLLLLLTIMLARYVALPLQYQPWPVLYLFATRLASKVNKITDSPAQQRLAGSLALCIIVLPLLTLTWTFRQLSEWPAGFDALLLYFCLDHHRFGVQIHQMADSLVRQQHQLAKDQLQPLMRRDCHRLSPAGLAKAGIEVLVQRQLRHFSAVLFWYLLAGPLTMLIYRLVAELQQAWSGKLSEQRVFGTPVAVVGRLMIWPVMWLQGTLVALLYRFLPAVRYFRGSDQAALPAAERWYLSAWSAALQRNLAGPVMYQGKKIRRVRIGPEAAPELNDLWLTLKLERQVQRIVWLLIGCTTVLMMLYQWR